MFALIIPRPQKIKSALKKKLTYRFHPARLLYVFTAFLLINILGAAIQTFFAAGPFAIFDVNQLRQSFTGRFATAYPQIFWLVVGICLVATPLGWYLNQLYNKVEKERERKETQQEISTIVHKEK